nr:hypothetical protein [Babesia bovis]
MLVIVVLPTFARAVMETIRDRTDDSVVSVTLFEGSSDDKEFIAIIKGVKTKVKSIIGALATTVADTVERKDYCQIAYPSPDGLSSQVLPNIKSTVKNGKKSDMAEIEKMLPQDLLGNDDTYMGATHSHKDTEMDKYMNNTPKWDMKDGVCSLDSTIGANDEQLSVEISAAALLAQTSPRILKYPVNMTILIPADKASEVVSLSRASKCYCSTTPTDDPKTVALSVNGSLQESTSLVSVIISVIH